MTFWASIWPLTALCKDIVASLWGCDLSFSVLCSGRLGSCVYVSQFESLLTLLFWNRLYINGSLIHNRSAVPFLSRCIHVLLRQSSLSSDLSMFTSGCLEQRGRCFAFERLERSNNTLTDASGIWVTWQSKEKDHVSHEVYNQPNVYFRSPWFSVIWCQLSNRTNIFSDFLICCSELLRHSCESS